jgi:hypothetical protein
MFTRKILLAAVAALALATGPTLARPQLATASIGWIELEYITCEATSDHVCTVNEDLVWTTAAASMTDENKYRVRKGTELVILDDGGNDLFYHADEAKGRVEVAIVIPADWDRHGNLQPTKKCHLKKSGKFRRSCRCHARENSNARGRHRACGDRPGLRCIQSSSVAAWTVARQRR